jgi:hypothetical protein
MEQAMRIHYGLGVAEAVRPKALQNLTPPARRKTYARRRNPELTLIRLKDLQIDMARRQVAQIEAMIIDLDDIAATLDNEIGNRGKSRGGQGGWVLARMRSGSGGMRRAAGTPSREPR